VTFVRLTYLNTPSTEAYGGYVPPVLMNIIHLAVKKNELLLLDLRCTNDRACPGY
jgi:hypothetical protein